MTQQIETALNITVGMEVALVRYGSWEASYTKWTVCKVLKNNRFRLKAAHGVIADVVWTAKKCLPNYFNGERRAPAHAWRAKTSNTIYRNEEVVPWDATVEAAVAAKKDRATRNTQIDEIKRRVDRLHYTQPALIERLLAALGAEG